MYSKRTQSIAISLSRFEQSGDSHFGPSDDYRIPDARGAEYLETVLLIGCHSRIVAVGSSVKIAVCRDLGNRPVGDVGRGQWIRLVDLNQFAIQSQGSGFRRIAHNV